MVKSGQTESVHLEYKREVYKKSVENDGKFRKQISAFANTLGGHLIIGIEELDSGELSLNPIKNSEIDEATQRLENLARTNIEPPVVGIKFNKVRVEGGFIIIIFVPSSINPPHGVRTGGGPVFYLRNSSGAYHANIEELRQLFGKMESGINKVKAFTTLQIHNVQAREFNPLQQNSNPRVVIHMVPIPDFISGRIHELSLIEEAAKKLPLFRDNIFQSDINLHGAIKYNKDGIENCEYVQLFRNGTIELVSENFNGQKRKKALIGATLTPSKLREIISENLILMKKIEATPPILLQITFLEMMSSQIDYDLKVGDRSREFNEYYLHLPHSIISEYDECDNYDKIIAKQLDLLWNAYGQRKCELFDEDGNWKGN